MAQNFYGVKFLRKVSKQDFLLILMNHDNSRIDCSKNFELYGARTNAAYIMEEIALM